MTMDEARQIAAQAWCDPETSGIEMDVRLAEAFARRLVAQRPTICIGWTTIRRVAAEGAVWFDDIGAGLVAADDLFHAEIPESPPGAASEATQDPRREAIHAIRDVWATARTNDETPPGCYLVDAEPMLRAHAVMREALRAVPAPSAGTPNEGRET